MASKSLMLPILVTFTTVLVTLSSVQGELYTALVEMEDLLITESVLVDALDGFISVQEQRLEILKRKSLEYQREHADAAKDIQTYVSNPINAYLLTKRLTTDWKAIESMMLEDVGREFVSNITRLRDDLKFPSDEDLNGAAVALMRLQDTYKLETSSVARGELNGVQYSTALTAGDCFELGRQSYNNGDFYHTVLWMQEAMQRLQMEKNKTTTREDILEYLAFSTYMQGNLPSALAMTNELLEIVPNHQRALGNKVYYENKMVEEKVIPSLEEKINEEQYVDDDASEEVHVPTERELYEKLCRGELGLGPREQASLKCHLVTNDNPYLLIGPFKVEEVHRFPRILIFHDIIYDTEIATIKRMAQPRFKRATVQNYKTGELETANYRISKSAWLKSEEHRHVYAVAERVRMMTGLEVDTAEELQVVNYGIGGHYEPHFDFARKEEVNAFKSLGTGNRIATVLFYMSDVAQGGATVFPALKTSLWPKKGTAAFWYNLHPSGEGDYLTRHAACPVLAGSKWVSNKWLHERGQEFLRPCELNPEAAESTRQPF
ncbi:prolyl 4-hydroxylase subunit alpha-1-like [Ctenocephalides felis]|uniref:prolyl 4-hydroxylase subunit alpha-1-like n=1 Tax=Ctenocephalides felis TaxID=7515 RepID=UPI000E6E35B3|nr:prolyl 4-hydroxylase subunit alpha-1-like [Ctenocephalides felis]